LTEEESAINFRLSMLVKIAANYWRLCTLILKFKRVS